MIYHQPVILHSLCFALLVVPLPAVSPTDPTLSTFSMQSFLDLVNPNQNIRFAAIAQLAQWVGSNISESELCCLAVHHTHFMGSHDRTEKNVAGGDDEDNL